MRSGLWGPAHRLGSWVGVLAHRAPAPPGARGFPCRPATGAGLVRLGRRRCQGLSAFCQVVAGRWLVSNLGICRRAGAHLRVNACSLPSLSATARPWTSPVVTDLVHADVCSRWIPGVRNRRFLCRWCPPMAPPGFQKVHTGGRGLIPQETRHPCATIRARDPACVPLFHQLHNVQCILACASGTLLCRDTC